MPHSCSLEVQHLDFVEPQGDFHPVTLSFVRPRLGPLFRLSWNSTLLLSLSPFRSSFQATLIVSSLPGDAPSYAHLDFSQEILGHATFPTLYIAPLRPSAPEGLSRKRLPPNPIPRLNYHLFPKTLKALSFTAGDPKGRGSWWASRLTAPNDLPCTVHSTSNGVQFWIPFH
jgi:hypothetical protein